MSSASARLSRLNPGGWARIRQHKWAKIHGHSHRRIFTADNAALEAAKAANLVLVPCQPSDFDVRTVGATVRLCEQVAGKEAWVVMNAIPPPSKITEEAVEALTASGVRVCPVKLVRRLDFVNGLPEGMAAFEWNSKGKASK